ncbi:MAG: PAS domain-containing protein [Nitrospiraceae bacterium]|nr:MAG: PAS domain-containing protein [Nitrospiraceae bacterium]
MKRRFFKRTFLLYFIVLLGSALFIELYVTKVVENNYLNELRERLSIQNEILAEKVSFHSRTKEQKLSTELKEITHARVTIIDAQGNVLGDSEGSAESMDNHSDRPEIQEAGRKGTGWSLRKSRTQGYDLLYVAKSIYKDNSIAGFIRLAVPVDQINKSINILKLEISLVVIVLFLVSGIVMTWNTNRIRQYMDEIIEYSGALAHGIFRQKLYLRDAGEFTELANNLNNMSAELKDKIERARKETSRLDVILKSIPDSMLLINTSGIIKLANKAALKLFGFPQLYGKPFLEVIRNPDFVSLIDGVIKSRSPLSAEITIDVPEEKYLFVKLSPLAYTVGDLSGVIAIFTDLTHMRKLEQVRKDFVANASHELKTPVTAIKGFAETLLDGAIEDRENAYKFLNTIKDQSDRLNRLVEDLLVLSNIETGKEEMNLVSVDLSMLIDKVMNTMVVKAAEKNIMIKKSADDITTVHADRDKVEQVLLNLVDNAIKFTDSGEIEIGIVHEDRATYVYVKDAGIGIPERYIPRLGERFFRVDASRSRELGGTGLGLAIVKHIVKEHGWKMQIESKPGRGTMVKIFLS